MTRSRVLRWTLAVAALAALAIVGLASTGASARRAPALPREVLVGPPVTLASLRGRPALVVFWASWCPPCVREAPAVERFAKGLHGRARLVGVNWNDALNGARAFLRSYHWSFPNLRDDEGAVGERYGLTGLPTTFVLDRYGRIRATLRGPQTEATLARALARLS